MVIVQFQKHNLSDEANVGAKIGAFDSELQSHNKLTEKRRPQTIVES